MITLQDIGFSYKRNHPVLESIQLELKPGSIYGLLGKNGEGKTTLLKIISGLIFPDRGTCRIEGEEPSDRKAALLQHLFLLPEEITFPDVTVQDYIKMYAPFYPTFKDEILQACVESFEIDTRARLAALSQGQKKKAAITLALAANTPLLLMDEPTNGLDIPSKTIFRRLVSSFVDEERIVVISTHQVRDLESLIDAVVILDSRQILLNASLDEIGRRLFFRLVDSPAKKPEAPGRDMGADQRNSPANGEQLLYTESTPAGRMGVGVNRTGEITPVSLELLFNAAISNQSEIRQLFASSNL